MKAICLFVVIVLTAFFFGCSNSSNPATPQENLSPIPIANVPEEGTAILGAGTMDLDTGEVIPSRDLSGYLNVTPYLGSNFSFSILRFMPPCYFEVEFSLTNPTSITVWDVCLVFENLYGKSILYPDSYMDIYQQYDPDPAGFFAYDDDRDEYCTFLPGATHTTRELIKYPAGASSRVDYFIIAHLGGNTGGVKELYGNVWNGALMPDGGSATLGAYVYDYQNDVQMVVADTTPITGGLTFLHPTAEPEEWSAEITNSQGAPSGTYSCWMMAKSPSVPQYNTFTKVEITVAHYPTTLYVDDNNVSGPWDGSLSYPFRYIQDAIDYAVDGDTIHVMPGIYHEGEQNEPYDSPGIHIYSLDNVTIQGEGLPVIAPAQPFDPYDLSVFEIYSCNNIVIDGFEITPQPHFKTAFNLHSSSNTEIKNCVITPATAPGFEKFIYASYCSGLQIENNTLDGMVVQLSPYNSTNLIQMYSCNDAVFSLNSFRNPIFPSITSEQYFYYSIFYCSNSGNLTLTKNVISGFHCTITGTGSSSFQVFDLSGCDNSVIRNNLIHDIQLTNLDGYCRITVMDIYTGNGTAIYNNTIDSIITTTNGSAESSCMRFDSDGMTYNLHSNIITRSWAPANGWSYGVASPNFVTQSYSDVWSIKSARYYWNAQEGVGGLDVDPQYVDYLNGDYHLDPLSQCVGTGLDGFDMGCYGGADPLP